MAEEVERLLDRRPVDGVRVVTSTRGGFELIDLLAGSGRVLVVDCFEAVDAQPGRMRVLPLEGLCGCARLVGGHDVGLSAAIQLGRLLGVEMPERVEVIGVEAVPGDRIEEGLSPALAAAVPIVAAWIYRRLAGDDGPPRDQLG